jgi:hypothetical protein
VTSGDTYGLTTTNKLVTFDRGAPELDTAIAITGLQSGENVLAIDIRPGGTPAGQLYALGSSGRLYTVDTTTGVATQKSVLAADAADTTDAYTALAGTEYGIDFNPVGDRLRIVSDTGANLRVDPDTGATFTDGGLATDGAARTGVIAAAYTNSFADACRTALYYIDASTDRLLTTADPNSGAVSEVGALGIDASAVGEFEIVTAADGSNSAVAVLAVGDAVSSYTVDLTTGVATATGPVTRLETGEQLRGAAIAPPATAPTQQAGDVFALTESNKLVSFNPALPGKLCTSVAITGQQSGENVVGIDVRPEDNTLYALGSTGRVYAVDTASGALTLKSTLVAAIGDVTTPYAGLSGTSYGVDFNPGNDVLRVVSDTGQNFRVDIDNGVTTTDVALNPAVPVPAEGAYGNSFVGTITSFFYAIDAATDTLQVLGRPSGNAINGDLQAVGALGAGDVQALGGFDILGTNNQGLAALNVAGATSSDLFTINLATGAATRVATVGGGEKLRGLSFARLPVATVFGLTTTGRLVSFKPLTPGTFDTDVAVTGLASGESLVSLDVRPSNGLLYGLTSGGKVVSINPETGVASGSVTLTAEPLDTTDAFTALAGTRFSIDFNAVDGALRVHSDTGQDLRVNVDSGATITDGALQGTPLVGGTAISNSFAGAGNSDTYVLDLTTSTLRRQTSINGSLVAVGTGFGGGLTFASGGGFDIAGGENGLAVASLNAAGATQSTLYRVSIANGALTSLGLLGPTGAAAITALAIQLK